VNYTFNANEDTNRFCLLSDHYNFAKKNNPNIFYFNDTHADYHLLGDTPIKSNMPY